MFLSIFLLSCALFHVTYGQLGNLGGALGAAQAAQGLTGGASNVVPKCDAPIDHSCDDMSFNDIASKVAGGGLLAGATKGTGLPTGLDAASGLLGGGRRRRGLFDKGLIPNHPAAAAPSNPVPAAASNPAGHAGQFGSLLNTPGTSFFSDPKSMGPTMVQNKLNKCDEQNKPGGQFDNLKQQLTSGDFTSLTNPQAISAGDTCKQFMNTEKEQCQMLKRQVCAFMNGGVKNPSQLSCAFKDIISTAGKVQAQNSACDTAQQLMKNPNNAAGILQNGAKGAGTGLLLNQGANNALG